MDPELGIGAAVGQHLVEGTEVFEDFEAAGLDALRTGAVEGMGRPVDDPHVESPPYEVDRHSGARRARTYDQYVDDLRVVHESSLSARAATNGTI
ncbi:UNVERIFIED_CONTAM: hypothetical protein RKD50_009345 [Streptomyces canus]